MSVPLMATLLGLLAVCPAHAQTNLQLWGNVTVDWVKSDRLVYELDFEPKVLVDAPDGAPSWRNLDVTPNAEYSPMRADLQRLRRDTTTGRAATAVPPRTPSRRGLWIGAAAALVLALAASWLGREAWPPKGEAGSAARAETQSIAVLPFVDMSPDKDQEYFAEGLSEELLNVLAHIPELRVAGRTSSFQFKGKNEDIRQKLNVAAILEGSVRKSGSRVRITAQLVKVADGLGVSALASE